MRADTHCLQLIIGPLSWTVSTTGPTAATFRTVTHGILYFTCLSSRGENTFSRSQDERHLSTDFHNCVLQVPCAWSQQGYTKGYSTIYNKKVHTIYFMNPNSKLFVMLLFFHCSHTAIVALNYPKQALKWDWCLVYLPTKYLVALR